MKKIIALASIIVASLTFSCREENVQNEAPVKLTSFKSVKYKEIEALMPIDYPSELVNYNEVQLKEVALANQNKNLRITQKKTLTEIVENVYAKYPSFDNFDAKAYKKYFPKLTEAEIIANSESILSYMEKLMGYEVADVFSKEGDGIIEVKPKKNKNGRVGINILEAITECETWYYLAHLRMDWNGIYTARDKAFESSSTVDGNAGGAQDKIDALRHGVWGSYVGKYACYRYGSVSEAYFVAKGFVESHECNQSGPDTEMDAHNNKICLGYYLMNAERVKVNFINYNVVLKKEPSEITSTMRDGYGFVQVANDVNSIRNASVGKLVYIY